MAKREAEIIMAKHWRIIVVVFLVDALVSQSLNNIRIDTTDDLLRGKIATHVETYRRTSEDIIFFLPTYSVRVCKVW